MKKILLLLVIMFGLFGSLSVLAYASQMVPLRPLVEDMNGTVHWNPESKKVTINKGNLQAVITVDSNRAEFGQKIYIMDKPVEQRDGTIFVSSQFINILLNDAVGIIYENQSQNPRQFPALHVNTNGEELTREWAVFNLTLENTDGTFEFEDLPTRVRGRGSSTWFSVPDWSPKRPFRIRFDQPRELLDIGFEARDWTIIANHFDRSMLRQYSAYHLGYLMSNHRDDNLFFSPTHRFIDVYMDGEYHGVFMLSDQTNESVAGRSNLQQNANPEQSEFMLELENRVVGEEREFIRVNRITHEIRFPSGNALTDAHITYARNFMTNIDTAIRQKNFTEISRLIDVPSFVDAYLIHELYRDHDFQSSLFMQIRGFDENRRLYKGPIWDFDTAAGVAMPGYLGMVYARNVWYSYLLDIPEFYDLVVARWNDIKDNEVATVINYIKSKSLEYQNAFERNFEVWPILGLEMWPKPPAKWEIDTFLGNVEFLVDILEARIEFLDSQFNPRPYEFAFPWRLGNPFLTQNGSWTNSGLRSDGSFAQLLFGPYIGLLTGSYEIAFTISVDNHSSFRTATLGVNGLYPEDKIEEIHLAATDFIGNGSHKFVVPFTLSRFTRNIEFRVRTYDGSVLTVEGLTLTRK